jgi:HK97 family phage portal protein
MPKTRRRGTYSRLLRRSERRALDSPRQSTGLSLSTPALSGVLITPQTALTFTAVYAAINVIATDTASLPLRVFKRLEGGGCRPAPEHYADRLLFRSPNGETPSMRWRQAGMGHVLGWGNWYAEIEHDNAGRPIKLELLSPSQTKPERDKNKQLYYALKDLNKTLPPRKVIHVAGLGYNGLEGYSPIGLAREAVGLGKGAEEFGASFFGNGAIPKGLLKLKKKLSPDAIENLRRTFGNRHQGTRNGSTMGILEEDMDWVNTQISPEDAQFLATRQFQVVEIARIFRLPPHKIGDFSQAHLANVDAANLDYLTTSLMPWLEAIEQELNLKLLTEQDRLDGYYIEHTMAALLRGDMRARGEFYKTLRDLGAINPNEIRQKENMNPIAPDEGGDKFLVPLNMTTLDRAGRLPTESPPSTKKPAKPGQGDAPTS